VINKIIFTILGVSTLLLVNTSNAFAATCSPDVYYTSTNPTLDLSYGDLPTFNANVIIFSPGYGDIDTYSSNLPSPWVAVPSPFQVRFEAPTPQPLPTSINVSMTLSNLPPDAGFGIQTLFLDLTTSNDISIDCSTNVIFGTNPLLNSGFLTGGLTTYTSTITNVINSNMIYIVGLLALLLGLGLIISLLRRSVDPSSNKLWGTSTNDDRLQYSNRGKYISPDETRDYWRD